MKKCVFCGKPTLGDDTCQDCLDMSMAFCVMCGEKFSIGNDGNELGICERCSSSPDFPYDLDAYYRAYDSGEEIFKGFDTLSRGILERYRK